MLSNSSKLKTISAKLFILFIRGFLSNWVHSIPPSIRLVNSLLVLILQFQIYRPRFRELISNVVTKQTNNSNLPALNRIIEVDPLNHNISDSDVHFPKKRFKHNPKARYEPKMGQYLQVVSGKNQYNQTIVVSIRKNDTLDSDDAIKQGANHR